MEESDSDEEAVEEERSIVLNNGSDSDSNKETNGSLDSVSGEKINGEYSGEGSCESGSEEEKETSGQIKPESHDEKVVQPTNDSCLEAGGSEVVKHEKEDSDDPEYYNMEVLRLSPSNCGSDNNCNDIEKAATDTEVNGVSESKPSLHEKGEESMVITDSSDGGNPLNFDDFSLAAEMEVCLCQN